jgi:hypothetical protein
MVVVDLDTVSAAGSGVAQVRQQRAVAAAEVKDAARRLHPLGDLREVETQVHRAASAAMLSK